MVFGQAQKLAFLCTQADNNTVSKFELNNNNWELDMMFCFNKENILMLSLSENEHWCIGTITKGFKLWSVDGRMSKCLLLPNNVRNVNKKPFTSSGLVLSAGY